jgi:hypothetical protein
MHLALALAQQLVGRIEPPPRVVMLTCGALAFGGAPSDAAHGGAWGFARVLRLEHPSLVMMSVGVSSSRAAMTTRSTTLGLGVEGEPETCWMFGRPFASRLRASGALLRASEWACSSAFHSLERFVITGGLGALGLRTAMLLSAGGVTEVTLTSRTGSVARGASNLLASSSERSTVLQILPSDAADASDVALVFRLSMALGILHTAGMISDGLIRSKSSSIMSSCAAPKALAAFYMHTISSQLPLDVLGLFSSLSSFGVIGQADYTAANCHLDASASSWRTRGIVCSSLQIPAVRGYTMSTFSTEQLDATMSISLHEFAVCICILLSHAHSLSESTLAPLRSGKTVNPEEGEDVRPLALWRDLTLRERLEMSHMSEALLDQMMMASQRELPQSTVDIAVVGAGLTGISVSTHFASAGVDLVLLEKTFTVGGVW